MDGSRIKSLVAAGVRSHTHVVCLKKAVLLLTDLVCSSFRRCCMLIVSHLPPPPSLNASEAKVI